MTKHESSIWFLFKECFTEEWVKGKSPCTLLGIGEKLQSLLFTIDKRLEQFE